MITGIGYAVIDGDRMLRTTKNLRAYLTKLKMLYIPIYHGPILIVSGRRVTVQLILHAMHPRNF